MPADAAILGHPLRSGSSGRALLALALVAGLFAVPSCRRQVSESPNRLVATIRREPRTLNRFMSSNPVENVIALLTQATLVRVNRATGALEPRLARTWSVSPDGLAYTLHLRDDLAFSDGAPFTAADVVFTFEVLYDRRVGSQLTSYFQIDSRPLTIRAIDDHTVNVTFPSSYGPGLTLLDSLPILPKHKLDAAYRAGRFAEAWNLQTPPSEIVGLGPFVLTEYASGQHLRFARNPRFLGKPLPHLDEIELDIVPEQNAEVLRLESGQSDLAYDFARAEDLALLRQDEARGKIRLVDAGIEIAPEALWFDLAPGAPHAKDRPWLQRDELRQAISYAVDRKAIVDSVYLGAAVPIGGPMTPGHGEWYAPDLPQLVYDPARAKALLAKIGLVDRDGDGKLEDARNQPARFSILTTKGSTIRERASSVIQDQLRRIGLAVDVVPVETGQLIAQFGKGDYDAIYYGFHSDAIDPALNSEFWMSAGSFHLWNPQQPRPATAWEAKIDDLMRQQSTTLDSAERHRLFREVQMIFSEHLPCVYFAAPKAIVAMSARVRGATPSMLQPPVLWNAEVLSVAAANR